MRLSLTQTLMLLRHEGRLKGDVLPVDDSQANCLKLLAELEATHRDTLKAWSWHWYLKRALGPQGPLETARALRNATRHSMAPAAMQATWTQLLPCLLGLMDLSAYWAQHPLWVDIRPGTDGLTGERIAANQWPRQRKPLPPPVANSRMDFRSSAVWQSAVLVDDSKEAKFQMLSWRDLLQLDSNGRACWMCIAEQNLRGRRNQVWLDIDGGGVMTRSAP
jgi:hypothetical protein